MAPRVGFELMMLWCATSLCFLRLQRVAFPSTVSALNLKPYSLCSSKTLMATNIDESKVGIFCFISKLPGFRGILKQRSSLPKKKKKNRRFQNWFKFWVFFIYPFKFWIFLIYPFILVNALRINFWNFCDFFGCREM